MKVLLGLANDLRSPPIDAVCLEEFARVTRKSVDPKACGQRGKEGEVKTPPDREERCVGARSPIGGSPRSASSETTVYSVTKRQKRLFRSTRISDTVRGEESAMLNSLLRLWYRLCAWMQRRPAALKRPTVVSQPYHPSNLHARRH
jgi:hypothetical protein